MQSIRVYTPKMQLLDEVDNYQSLQFERSFYGVGKFELHINMHLEGAESFEKGNLIVLDKQAHKAGIIMSKEVELDENGKASENFKLTGYSLDGLISRRITVPPVHTSHDRRSGSAELVMKHYVINNFIDPVNSERKMPLLEVAPNLNRGKQIKWESRYKNVAEELEVIGQIGDLGWVVYADIPRKKLIFDVVESKDLTQGNTQGNSPVFFSPDFSTVESQNFVNSDHELRNVGYVGGQGEGVDRKIIILGNTSGWNRIEEFIDARDVGTEDEESEEELTEEEIEQRLIERGIQKMREMQTILSFEAEILTPITRKVYERNKQGYVTEKIIQETPFEYEKDFNLGDTVDVFNKSWGVTMKAPIVAVREIHEHDGYKLEATFGEERPTLISKMKQKFDELSGVENQELPSRIEIQANEYTDYLDEIIRDNLNLDGKLPPDVIMNSDGITGVATTDKYARLNHDGLTIQGGAIRIVRGDGAIYMQDGYTYNDYSVSSYDPHLTTQKVYDPNGTKSTLFFNTDGWYEAPYAHLDGRTHDSLTGPFRDVRDSNLGYTIRFQRYEFVHSAKYLRITYQIARNNIVGKHRLRVYEYDVERGETGQMLYEDVYEEGDRGIKDIYIDLGVPTYRTISVDLRLGHVKQWGAATKRYRFRIPRVVQTDFKS